MENQLKKKKERNKILIHDFDDENKSRKTKIR